MASKGVLRVSLVEISVESMRSGLREKPFLLGMSINLAVLSIKWRNFLIFRKSNFNHGCDKNVTFAAAAISEALVWDMFWDMVCARSS